MKYVLKVCTIKSHVNHSFLNDNYNIYIHSYCHILFNVSLIVQMTKSIMWNFNDPIRKRYFWRNALTKHFSIPKFTYTILSLIFIHNIRSKNLIIILNTFCTVVDIINNIKFRFCIKYMLNVYFLNKYIMFSSFIIYIIITNFITKNFYLTIRYMQEIFYE